MVQQWYRINEGYAHIHIHIHIHGLSQMQLNIMEVFILLAHSNRTNVAYSS